MIAISILFYTHWKGSEKSFLFRSSHRLFNSLTGYPVIRQMKPDIRQMKPDIRPDTGYKKCRISGQPDIRYNPTTGVYIFTLPPPFRGLKKNKTWSQSHKKARSGSVISRNESEDPDPEQYQNETDPQHCGDKCYFLHPCFPLPEQYFFFSL